MEVAVRRAAHGGPETHAESTSETESPTDNEPSRPGLTHNSSDGLHGLGRISYRQDIILATKLRETRDGSRRPGRHHPAHHPRRLTPPRYVLGLPSQTT
jgi:hypothetical protein